MRTRSISIASTALIACHVLLISVASAQNLVHHWDFDSDAGVTGGALVGGAKVAAGVLQLDGTSGYVQFSGNLVPASPTYTVALFARGSSGTVGDFISQGNAGAAFFIGVGNAGSVRAGDNWPAVAGSTFIADGEFHHYALTMSASEATFYIDGVRVGENAPFAGGAGGTFTRLGRGVGDTPLFFAGALDDVRIYDDALSADAVRALAGGALLSAERNARITP